MRLTKKDISLKYNKGYVRPDDKKVLPFLFIKGVKQDY